MFVESSEKPRKLRNTEKVNLCKVKLSNSLTCLKLSRMNKESLSHL